MPKVYAVHTYIKKDGLFFVSPDARHIYNEKDYDGQRQNPALAARADAKNLAIDFASAEGLDLPFYVADPYAGYGNTGFNTPQRRATNFYALNDRTGYVLVEMTDEPLSVHVEKDGDAYCARYSDFVDLQTSPAEFAEDPQTALEALLYQHPRETFYV